MSVYTHRMDTECVLADTELRCSSLCCMVGRADLFNLDCRIMNFIHSLKERCQVDPQGSSEGAEVQRYVPLLADVDRMHPELADVVRKLSNPSKENDKKPGAPRRGLQTHSRNRPNASVKKNVSTPRS
ncbi:uncharacterized protein LOC125294870 isoform X3 [Alosa alosa]|uniref:uncharacterized protein LOC121714975 isoform X3 n=1 Tax=Alosa sapidissima TaxID=34773 RepID=UPI001C09BE6A|nr:uncharacterized protein LOC121714975 isoform X3 [Alosa sapidissima]XP_048099877.1 uncharacterized protein LOC125294870 isoform X3 [Alosa alosa]